MGQAKIRLWRILINTAIASTVVPNTSRVKVYRRAGITVGDDVRVCSGVWIDTKRLTVGSKSFINHDCRISNLAHVTIGERVSLASRVMITTEGHTMIDPERRAGPIVASPVFIGDGTWIGAGAFILPGVTIGAGCIIAAGAVVIKDCKPHSLYAGVPAQWKKDLPMNVD